MTNTFVIILWLICLTERIDSLSVQLYTQRNYKGTAYTCSNVNEGAVCPFVNTAANDNTKSAYVTNGTCAVLWETAPRSGTSLVIAYPNLITPDFGTHNNKISSLEGCTRSTGSLSCPPNTFVRKFSTRNDNYLSYFSAECYPPSRTTNPVAILNSHPSTPGTPTTLTCDKGALRGVSFKYGHAVLSRTEPTFHSISGSCSASGNFKCGNKEAVCGFTTKTEEHSDVILGLNARCCAVGDPSALCIPEDEFLPILTCDNLESLATTTCRYSDTVGVGTSYTEGTSAGIELNFYGEIGGSAGIDIMGLSANFQGKLGASLTTKFDWNKASSSTWQKQVTYEVTMDVPPCIKTVLLQVVGKCSFYEVHATHYKRIDTSCDGTRHEIVGTQEVVLGAFKRTVV